MRTAPRRAVSEAGFSLIELLGVVTVFAIIAGMTVPALKDMTESIRLGQAAREVERELQTARLKAVTSSRPIRVRFNCPTSGKYRMVELIGTPSANAASDTPLSRCQETAFPPGATDNNPLTVPNHDGPVRTLHESVSFGATQPLEFWPDGSVHSDPTGNPPAAGSSWPVLPTGGTAITLTKSGTIKTITVNGLGKIQLQ